MDKAIAGRMRNGHALPYTMGNKALGTHAGYQINLCIRASESFVISLDELMVVCFIFLGVCDISCFPWASALVIVFAQKIVLN